MLQKELQRRGFIENNQEELNLQIPIEGHTAESIRNLIFMIHSKQYLLKRAVGTEVLHMSERLIERLSEEKDADMNMVMEIFEEEKVHCFGLEFVADKIVFNGFPMEAESTIYFAELTCMMAERAKEMKWINPAETIEANEKYYMRIWLIRLGLGGKGGKKTRDILLKNLKGNTAFRTEEEKERAKERNRHRAAERKVTQE